ncbi:MAG: ABC transporter ATP-binding protein/permease [Acutalibacteraceae bacterium]|nr:ABC transporter ATP-binding protein/permease [Acutalibacteraceae bacterium]
MMINKRLIQAVPESKKYIALNVALQWLSLAANIVMIGAISFFLQKLLTKTVDVTSIVVLASIAVGAIIIRFLCTVGAARMSYLSSKSVKKTLRHKIYSKLLRLGSSYNSKVSTSEVVQMSVEGVDQLDIYFASYLPQFFYSMIAPITLFVVLCFINWQSALILLGCVPLIPISIALVQTFAKKLLSKYWGQYTALGDTFLENLQGLTTLKIYQADAKKNEEMNVEAEHFRKITMKVLTMQLNSISIMDIVAFGGAAAGIVMAVSQLAAGNIDFSGCIIIILLSADFFIPMRQLGSFFHIAMNGMAASDKIFHLLDLEEPKEKTKTVPSNNYDITCSHVGFRYNEEREILKDINAQFPQGSFTAIVGESGCGKSTLGGILMGRNAPYQGHITIGGVELSEIEESNLMQTITYISHNSYLFKGTVRDNLLMGNPDATDEQMWHVLEQTKLAAFLRSEQGLDTLLLEKASNLSGGQCQRLALSRALLHNSPIYIFDEATSNIDVESEDDIMEQIYHLAKTKTVILISHRLANVVQADHIYVMKNGKITEQGTHESLLEQKDIYFELYHSQKQLEQYGKEAAV